MSNPAAVEALFFAALEMSSPAERAAYLDSACGSDNKLRRQVDKLLNAHPRVGDFLSKPVVEQLAAAPGQPDATQELGGSTDGRHERAGGRIDGGPSDDEDSALGFLLPSARPDALGRIRHYEILEVLGRGGFGIVFRAFDEMLQRVVAVKVLDPRLAVSSPPRKRFLREARSSAKVRHEYVVQVYAVEEQPLPYLVMEFIPGETLQQRLDRTGPLETVEVVRIGRQIAEGLAAAHGMGLIHRDVKPANVLIENGPHPRVKITDFGLARAADDASLTQSGIVAGTPMYMAPEQAQGDTLDHRADLFSLGSVLYTMCAGRPPFRANNTLAVLKRVAEDTPRPIAEIIPEVPPWLCELIARLHAKKPEDRFASAQEVADLLARRLAQMQQPGNVPPISETAPTLEKVPVRTAPQAAPPVRPRFRAGRWAAAAAVLLLLGGLGITEATGVTKMRGTVVRLFTAEGTLVVEVDDPNVSITVDGADVVITGAGPKEIRLKPGSYLVEASKDGKLVSRELISVKKNGRKVVRVIQEALPPPSPPGTAWERSVAALPAAEQVKAVVARLRKLNPNFDGKVVSTIKDDVVTGLQFSTDEVDDVTPVRALKGLTSLGCSGTYPRKGKLSDLSPLKGTSLNRLECSNTQVSELTALGGMPLTSLSCDFTRISDLAPLRGMALVELTCAGTKVPDLSPLKGMKLQCLWAMYVPASDLTPLQGMPLTSLDLYHAQKVTNLKPLHGMPLEYLNLTGVPVSNLSVLKGMTSLRRLVLDDVPLSDLTPLRGLKLNELSIKGTRVSAFDVIKTLPLKRLRLDSAADRKEVLLSLKGLTHVNDQPIAQFWQDVEGQVKDPDRRAAEYALSIGGTVRVNDEDKEIKAGADLPGEAFRLTQVVLYENTQVSDAGLANFAGCKNLTWLKLHNNTQLSDAGLAHLKDCKKLAELLVQKTKVTAEGINELKKALPRCKIEWEGGVVNPN
jgi:eukaryotic-like serine/threonine-protein kinase